MSRWVWLNTERACQLTGDYDPEGLPHANLTSEWAVDGTDLGANTSHNGKLYIFFGDVPQHILIGDKPQQLRAWPPHDADFVACLEKFEFRSFSRIALAKQTEHILTALVVDAGGALCVASVKATGRWNPPVPISLPDFQAPAGAFIALAKQTDTILSALVVDAKGALCVASVSGTDRWNPPVPISPAGFQAPPGAFIALAKQTDSILTALVVDTKGILWVASVHGANSWNTPVPISPPDFQAHAGAFIALTKQTDTILSALVVDAKGVIWVASVRGTDPWSPMVPISPPDFQAPVGAFIALAKQTDTILSALVIDTKGVLCVASVRGEEAWNPPVPISPAGFQAPPGAFIALAKQTDTILSALVVDTKGVLCVASVRGEEAWNPPVPISPAGFQAPPGAFIALAKQTDTILSALVVDTKGVLCVASVRGAESWNPPVPISPAGFHARPGAFIALAKQTDSILTALLVDVEGTLFVTSVSRIEAWKSPLPIVTAPFRLNPVMEPFRPIPTSKNGSFHPFSVRPLGGQVWLPLTGQTPTGAFSYDGRVYVFFVAGEGEAVTLLTSTPDPASPTAYKWHFDVSDAAIPGSGRFFQIAPIVVKNSEIEGLPSRDGDGLILFGHGFASEGFGVNLAWMPLRQGQVPSRSDIRYYTGHDSTGVTWSNNESESRALFTTRFVWTSLSVGRVPGTMHWILLNQKAGTIEDNQKNNTWDEPIVARVASTPWGISDADEISIFDPIRESARGRYMASGPTTRSQEWQPNIGHPSFAYGAYLLNRYTEWDENDKFIAITYLMSTGHPYQVQLMRSRIKLVH